MQFFSVLPRLSVLGILAIVGAYPAHASETVTPRLQKESSAQVGDAILHQGTLVQRAAIHLSDEITFGRGGTYALTPGYYFRTGQSIGWETYAPADGPDAGRVNKARDAITLQGSFLYSDDGTTVAVITNFYQAVNAKATGISRTTRPSFSKEAIQRSLIYGGVSGTRIKLAYQETWKNVTRPSRHNFLEFDIANTKSIESKGAQIEVIDATEDRIRYRVTRGFDSLEK